ncbi:hypothetical protein ASPCADRAFT_203521 [Aspergillus carbonarius ITEM 5010]|uniref:Uncharacterized protein n=1 Tax=Aspergillus carbonarius (strain ITEM 5010) TaxID=602072 RepID=A0A1R3RZ51_ASPC5|nr:hypothetical protein ASPCADRAFT_203521 [Aspergillus carbonarius ITEM 5010]
MEISLGTYQVSRILPGFRSGSSPWKIPILEGSHHTPAYLSIPARVAVAGGKTLIHDTERDGVGVGDELFRQSRRRSWIPPLPLS